eukprot:scaffold3545_cov124-Pinguiococcus_pyrenoidosus.AAC.1
MDARWSARSRLSWSRPVQLSTTRGILLFKATCPPVLRLSRARQRIRSSSELSQSSHAARGGGSFANKLRCWKLRAHDLASLMLGERLETSSSARCPSDEWLQAASAIQLEDLAG